MGRCGCAASAAHAAPWVGLPQPYNLPGPLLWISLRPLDISSRKVLQKAPARSAATAPSCSLCAAVFLAASSIIALLRMANFWNVRLRPGVHNWGSVGSESCGAEPSPPTAAAESGPLQLPTNAPVGQPVDQHLVQQVAHHALEERHGFLRRRLRVVGVRQRGGANVPSPPAAAPPPPASPPSSAAAGRPRPRRPWEGAGVPSGPARSPAPVWESRPRLAEWGPRASQERSSRSNQRHAPDSSGERPASCQRVSARPSWRLKRRRRRPGCTPLAADQPSSTYQSQLHARRSIKINQHHSIRCIMPPRRISAALTPHVPAGEEPLPAASTQGRRGLATRRRSWAAWPGPHPPPPAGAHPPPQRRAEPLRQASPLRALLWSLRHPPRPARHWQQPPSGAACSGPGSAQQALRR